MELYIGGSGQGKLAYVLRQQNSRRLVAEGGEAEEEMCLRAGIIDHFHLFIRRLMQDGKSPEEFLKVILERNPEIILISDEVGYGIVPVDAFEREYREQVGRTMCIAAEKADRVERIVCGIGQRLK